MPTLKQLLADGAIDPLAWSMTPDEVRLLIGACEGMYDYHGTTTEKHGQFQLTFETARLVRLDWIVGDTGHTRFKVTEGCVKPTTTPSEFLDYCDDAEIPWTIASELSFDRQLGIRTCDAVVAVFDLDQRELQRISINAK